MAESTQDSGKKINNMVRDGAHGLMENSGKGPGSEAASMAKLSASSLLESRRLRLGRRERN